MTLQEKYTKVAIKDHHVSRQKQGNRLPKGGAGRHNWGTIQEEIEDARIPIGEPFEDDKLELESNVKVSAEAL